MSTTPDSVRHEILEDIKELTVMIVRLNHLARVQTSRAKAEIVRNRIRTVFCKLDKCSEDLQRVATFL